jgi:2-dehydro-3-deoxygalactonokinase
VGTGTFIGVDWGTSRLRASLCKLGSEGLREIATRTGPGVLAARDSIEDTLFGAIQPWIADHGTVPLLLAGMVGSPIGWRTLPYLDCPVVAADISSRCASFVSRGHSVLMVPGLACVNDLGLPDRMRGEELQVLGWLASDPAHGVGKRIVCLPGTHTKWVTVRDGRIVSFCTAITGELYTLLTRHSVLLALDSGAQAELVFDPDEFDAGVEVAAQHRAAAMHLLFSTRSRMLKRASSPGAAASYLSGLLIGADCATFVDRGAYAAGSIAVVGEPELCRHFATALGRLGAACEVFDGKRAALDGFADILGHRAAMRDEAVAS